MVLAGFDSDIQEIRRTAYLRRQEERSYTKLLKLFDRACEATGRPSYVSLRDGITEQEETPPRCKWARTETAARTACGRERTSTTPEPAPPRRRSLWAVMTPTCAEPGGATLTASAAVQPCDDATGHAEHDEAHAAVVAQPRDDTPEHVEHEAAALQRCDDAPEHMEHGTAHRVEAVQPRDDAPDHAEHETALSAAVLQLCDDAPENAEHRTEHVVKAMQARDDAPEHDAEQTPTAVQPRDGERVARPADGDRRRGVRAEAYANVTAAEAYAQGKARVPFHYMARAGVCQVGQCAPVVEGTLPEDEMLECTICNESVCDQCVAKGFHAQDHFHDSLGDQESWWDFLDDFPILDEVAEHCSDAVSAFRARRTFEQFRTIWGLAK